MEIGKYLDFHTTCIRSQNYNVLIDRRDSKFALNVPINIYTSPTSTTTIPFQYAATSNFGNNKDCRMVFRDPTYSIY